jgi:hypothetical protein
MEFIINFIQNSPIGFTALTIIILFSIPFYIGLSLRRHSLSSLRRKEDTLKKFDNLFTEFGNSNPVNYSKNHFNLLTFRSNFSSIFDHNLFAEIDLLEKVIGLEPAKQNTLKKIEQLYLDYYSKINYEKQQASEKKTVDLWVDGFNWLHKIFYRPFQFLVRFFLKLYRWAGFVIPPTGSCKF